MRKPYHLLMNGQNFLVDMDGELAKHGFFQNFFLEAESPEQAEGLAVEKIKGDEGLKAITQNPKDDPPIIVLEDTLINVWPMPRGAWKNVMYPWQAHEHRMNDPMAAARVIANVRPEGGSRR